MGVDGSEGVTTARVIELECGCVYLARFDSGGRHYRCEHGTWWGIDAEVTRVVDYRVAKLARGPEGK